MVNNLASWWELCDMLSVCDQLKGIEHQMHVDWDQWSTCAILFGKICSDFDSLSTQFGIYVERMIKKTANYAHINSIENAYDSEMFKWSYLLDIGVVQLKEKIPLHVLPLAYFILSFYMSYFPILCIHSPPTVTRWLVTIWLWFHRSCCNLFVLRLVAHWSRSGASICWHQWPENAQCSTKHTEKLANSSKKFNKSHKKYHRSKYHNEEWTKYVNNIP